MNEGQQTAEDRAWFNAPVDIVVEQDDRAWLDTMLDMKPAELVNYAVFNYQVPEVAADALVAAMDRNSLIQMIVVANRAGGGQAVSTQQYIYIPELKGVYEPMVSLFNEKSDPLYLVRGEGKGQQIWNMLTSQWENLIEVRNKHTVKTAIQRSNAAKAADSVSSHPSFNDDSTTPPPAPRTLLPVLLPSVVAAVPSMKGDDLRAIAADLGIENAADQEKFPNNKAVAEEIIRVNEANVAANGQEG